MEKKIRNKICKKCGNEFIPRKRAKYRGNYMYCSKECYWKYHLKDILKGGDDNAPKDE